MTIIFCLNWPSLLRVWYKKQLSLFANCFLEGRHRWTHLSPTVCLSVHSCCLSICLWLYYLYLLNLSVWLFFLHSVCLFFFLSVCLSVFLSFFLFICRFFILSDLLSVCRSVCLSVCLSVELISVGWTKGVWLVGVSLVGVSMFFSDFVWTWTIFLLILKDHPPVYQRDMNVTDSM